MEIYAFGSVTRGEIDKFSDVDLLILKNYNEKLPDVNKDQYSIYTNDRMAELWTEGNPFAWHLYTESKCIFTSQKVSFIELLGRPNQYRNLKNDLYRFHKLFQDSKASINESIYSVDFDLSMIFLAIRNFASCFALGHLNICEFSRDSAIKINEYSIEINERIYSKLKQARLLATRGIGEMVSHESLKEICFEFSEIEKWFNKILNVINNG